MSSSKAGGQRDYGGRISHFRGVTKIKGKDVFSVNVNIGNKSSQDQRTVYLGRFDEEVEAARIRDLFVLKYGGRNSILNFPASEYSSFLRKMEGMAEEDFVADIRSYCSSFGKGMSLSNYFNSRPEYPRRSNLRITPHPEGSNRWASPLNFNGKEKGTNSDQFPRQETDPMSTAALLKRAHSICDELEKRIKVVEESRLAAKNKAEPHDLELTLGGFLNAAEETGGAFGFQHAGTSGFKPYGSE